VTNYIELRGEDLRLSFDNLLEFNTTEDIEGFDMVIGQKRAVASIDLGLKMSSKEYNIFISGRNGTGKTGYIVRKIEEYARKMAAPEDWCYVYNFDDPNTPMAIALSTGAAFRFKEDLAELVKYLYKEVPIFFNSQNYDRERNGIVEKYDKILGVLTKELKSKGKSFSFDIRETTNGEFLFIPLKDGKEMTKDEYSELSDEEKKLIESSVSELRLFSLEIIKETRELAKKMDEELRLLDNRIAESIVAHKIESLEERYVVNEKVKNYILSLKKDIIKNISYFFEEDGEEKKEKEVDELFARRYDVNVIVSNDAAKGAPVVFADSAQHGRLFGNVEYENKQGNLVTDFTLIRSGYLHRANGGFLIIKAHELLSYPSSWEMLKRCVNLEIIIMDNTKYSIDVLPISTLKPQNVPLKTKVILLGSNYLYSLLLHYDIDFEKLFKIKAEFDDEIENDKLNSANLAGFLRNYIDKNDLLHITRDGVKKLFQYSSRLAEDRNYFSASMSRLLKIVDIADFYAKEEKSKFIEERHVQTALEEDEAMHGLIRKKVLDMYKSKKYVVELKGSKVGQINGLSVANYGDCIVGQQHRITVSTYAGRRGVINIEREADMSGNIHNKGIMILSGFLGEFIGQEASISFNASIAFEQLYSGIEGDSASAAELIALLSSLSEIPIKQSLAITGSVNQKGEIQPIGAVNDKIEGYFDICSIFGLDGSHGVIIPFTNLEDLVLKDNILEALDKGLFHIYAVRTIEECLQILCEYDEDKATSEEFMGDIKGKILDKLRRYDKVLTGK
jgi:lon-related putative ATP-dependent protease